MRLQKSLGLQGDKNQSILQEIKANCSLEGQILKRKLKYFDHLMRREDSLERTLILGQIEGQRRRQQRIRWLDNVTETMNMNLDKLWELIQNMGSWLAVGHQESDTTKQL